MHMMVVLSVFGWYLIIVGALKGAYLLLAPAGQLACVVRWWQQLSPAGHRWWGLVPLLLGAAILVTR